MTAPGRDVDDSVVPTLEEARALLAAQPFVALLEARLDSLRLGQAQMSVPLSERVRQDQNIAHGGLIAFLADAALTVAAATHGGESVRTVDLTVNFLRPASGDDLVARAEVIQAGTRLVVCRCDLFDRHRDRETRCAAAQGTVATR